MAGCGGARFSSSTPVFLDGRAQGAAGCAAGVLRLFVGVVGAADQRAALDVLEAHLEAQLLEGGELSWRVVTAHRQVVLRGTEVLPDGQDVHVMLTQVEHGVLDLLLHLAQAHHETALGQPLGVELLGVAQDLERSPVLRLGTDRPVQARHGLDVVVEGVGPGVDDGLYGVPISLEIRREDLDGAAGDLFPDLLDGGGEDRGPAVLQLVTVHARYDGVLEAHLSGSVGDAARFVEVELGGLACEDGAEAAGAGADVAQDHEGRGAVVPALADVRAARLLADGVEVEAAHGLSYIAVALSHGRPGFKPLGPPVQTLLLPEGQILRRRPVRRRGHGTIFPTMTDLESLGTVVQDLQLDLSAGHSSPLLSRLPP